MGHTGKRVSVRGGAVLVAMLAHGLVPASAPAVMLQHAKNYVLPGSETIHDDLYVAGSVVDVQGTVDGDLIVAGQTVTIGGIVTGDVIAAGRDVTVSGSVAGTIRAAGRSVLVDGTVGHDVVVASGTLVTGPHASIGRDVLGASGTASYGGRISRDVRAGGGSVTFSGSVGGNAHVSSREVRVAEGAVLERDLFYRSREALVQDPGGIIRGKVEREQVSEPQKPRLFGGSPLVGWIRGAIGLMLLGLLFFLPFTEAGRRTLAALQSAPWRSLGIGILFLIATPFLTASFFVLGLFIGGWWLALGILVFYFFALALGYVVAATHLGRWLLGLAGRKGASLILGLVAGLFVLGVITVIPVVGGIVGLVAIEFGLGALLLAWARSRREARAAGAPPGHAAASVT